MKLKYLIAGGCLAALCDLAGCAATSFSRTGDFHPNPRAASCEFAVYTTAPTQTFKEIGAVRFNSSSSTHPTSGEEAKSVARHDVCKAGGTGLVLGPLNHAGYYDSGTIIWMK